MAEEMQLHALCEIFPEISGPEFDALVADISANGLRESIKLFEGQVLDGRNRYRACLASGVEPVFESANVNGDIAAYVLSLNLHRRQMSAAQAAAVVARITDWSKANQRGGRRATDDIPAIPLATVADRAKASGTSERTQRTADQVAKADPALIEEVAKGTMSLAGAVAKINEGKPKTPGRVEAEEAQNTAFGGADLVAELEAARHDIEKMLADLNAIESDSPQGVILSLRRQADTLRIEAERNAEVHAEAKKKATWRGNQLKRIGRLVGEDDEEKIAAAVEKALKANAAA